MTRNHVWRIKKTGFLQLKAGSKKIDARLGYRQVRNAHVGDTITYENYGENEFLIKRVSIYESFHEVLVAEGVENVMPGMTLEGAENLLEEIYSDRTCEVQNQLGVHAFELEDLRREKPKIIRASELLAEGKREALAKLVIESYQFMQRDDPELLRSDGIGCHRMPNWDYFSEEVPGIYRKTHEIVAAYIGNDLVGVAILRRGNSEVYHREILRLCADTRRSPGIAEELLSKSLKVLATTRPLITISDSTVGRFTEMIRNYGWKKSGTPRFDTLLSGHTFN